METELKDLLSNRKLVTYKVLQWIDVCTKGEICSILKFSRPTLDRRIKKHNWSLKEIQSIIKKIPF
jgi:hypothetical protein